jgi:hypothetical protein
VQARLGQSQRILLCSPASEANQRIQAVLRIVPDNLLGHIAHPPVDLHPVRFVTAGSEDSASNSQNARQRVLFQVHPAVFRQPAKAVSKPDQIHPVKSQCRFADSPYRRIKSRTVTAGRKNSDALAFCHGLIARLNRFFYMVNPISSRGGEPQVSRGAHEFPNLI